MDPRFMWPKLIFVGTFIHYLLCGLFILYQQDKIFHVVGDPNSYSYKLRVLGDLALLDLWSVH